MRRSARDREFRLMNPLTRRQHIFASLIAVAVTGSGCAPKDRDAGRDTALATSRTTRGAPFQVISQVADTTIVRSAGVATDPDDTIGTQYQKHEAPRWVNAPECLPTGLALCTVDTARTFRSGAVESGDGGMPDARETAWLVFAATRDSIQLFVVPSADSYLTMTPRSATDFFAEHAKGEDASWIRPRFPIRAVMCSPSQSVPIRSSATSFVLRL
jgi:hypothetical protein